MRDWLGDNFANQPVRDELVESMIEDGRAIVRLPDMDALVEFAATHFNVDDEAAWEAEDTSVLGAISNWRKERRDWQP
jgi:hypothetical protein